MNSSNLNFSVVTAKNGYLVPVVDGVHLHSAYDPEKEANNFLDANKEKIGNKKHVLILGLGFAYHVSAVYEYLKSNYKEFKIVVVEPNSNTTLSCVENELIGPMDNITIYSGKKIENLYNEEDFISFLLNKPALIQHAPSFNMYREYFQSLLTYQASQKVIDVFNGIENDNIKTMFSELEEGDELYNKLSSLNFDDFKDKRKFFFWNSLQSVIESGQKNVDEAL